MYRTRSLIHRTRLVAVPAGSFATTASFGSVTGFAAIVRSMIAAYAAARRSHDGAVEK